MTDHDQLLAAVTAAGAEVAAAQQATKEALRSAAVASNEARQARAEAIRAADDAGVPRELIAEAAGLQWPMSRQRWHQLRNG